MTKKNHNTAITAIFVSLSMLMSKVLGMVRDIILASLYGTESVEAIAFSTASRIPLLFFDIALGTAVTAAFIPIYNEFLQKGEKEKAYNFSNAFITLVSVVTLFMVVIGCIFSSFVVKIIAGGLDFEKLNLASQLVKILFPAIFTTGIAFCFVGILQSDGEFVIPAMMSLVSNLFLILYLVFIKDRFGVFGIAIAMLVSYILQIVIQIPSLKKMGYKLKLKNPIGDDAIKRVCLLALPIIVSAWVQPINAMININLASSLNNGAAVPALDYANKLYIILVGVFTYTITNLTFPSLSRLVAADEKEKYADVVRKSVKYVIFIIGPVMAGFILMSEPIIRVFYERGAFDAFSTNLTSVALTFYSIGMIGFGINEVMNKAFYSLKDGKTPMRAAVLGIVINISMSIILVAFFRKGLWALALSASVSANVTGFLLLYLLHKRVSNILKKDLLVSIIKTLLSILIMSIVVVLVKHLCIDLNKYFALLIPALSGAVVYVLMCVILKNEEFFDIIKTLLKKFIKKEA
ncbi:MAG: murein biosynthesis integral membrane protein MurJ [Ruminococcaceae bacterium]|nr:murein biosynthesis integral membrane protein MurJ [Oscillospiraceae bacterium]